MTPGLLVRRISFGILEKEEFWEVWGDYSHTLQRTEEGWKCSVMTFKDIHARGNEMARDYLPQQ